MPDLYVPLDVNFSDDPDVMEAGPAAELLYVRCLQLAKRTLSDGFVSDAQVNRLTYDFDAIGCDSHADRIAAADALADAGLLHRVEKGFQIVSWLKHNRSKADIRGQSDAGQKAALARWHAEGKHDGNPHEACESCGIDADRNAQRMRPDAPPTANADADPMPSRDRDIVKTPTPSVASPNGNGTDHKERFQALADACGLDVSQLTKNERGKLNAAEKQLREIHVDPEAISLAAKVWRRKFPDAELTPQAIANNWAQLRAEPDRVSSGPNGVVL